MERCKKNFYFLLVMEKIRERERERVQFAFNFIKISKEFS
jgi:hypothetical protein